MSLINIDMPQFRKYITNMETVVENIVAANRKFTSEITELEELGWRDDVYKMSRNQLFRMQEVTNTFIARLDELDNGLIGMFGRLHGNYAKTDFDAVSINMPRVEVLSDLVLKGDDHYIMSVETLERYIVGTTAYVSTIRAELDDFHTYHSRFAEYFQTTKYGELSESLKAPIATMEEIMEQMIELAKLVGERREALWEFS